MPLNLRSVHYFIVVAEELHFGRAALRLNIGQPPLSQQIRRLEEDLGVALFERSKRSVELTVAGQAFLGEARAVLAQAEHARLIAQKASRGEIGHLLIGFVPSGNHGLLTDILQAFRTRYPQVVATVQSLNTAAQLSGLADGRIHVGFVRLPIERGELEVRTIWREHLVVAMAENHPLAHRAYVDTAEVAKSPLIIFPRAQSPGFYQFIMDLFLQSKVEPKVIEETEHARTKLAMVSRGIGVSILSSSVMELGYKGVVYRQLNETPIEIETAIAYRRDRATDVLKAFLTVVDEYGRKGS